MNKHYGIGIAAFVAIVAGLIVITCAPQRYVYYATGTVVNERSVRIYPPSRGSAFTLSTVEVKLDHGENVILTVPHEFAAPLTRVELGFLCRDWLPVGCRYQFIRSLGRL